jgi:hypothetical protein
MSDRAFSFTLLNRAIEIYKSNKSPSEREKIKYKEALELMNKIKK